MKKMRINEKHNICGERLRKIRKRRGLSQEDLAAKLQLRGLDLTQKAISRIETGSRLVTDYELKYLTEVLNIPVRLLLEEEDSETTDPETVTAENFISAFQAGRFGESPTAHHPDKIIIDVTIRCLSDPPEKDK